MLLASTSVQELRLEWYEFACHKLKGELFSAESRRYINLNLA
jgi:hypothetical protein